MATGTRTSYTDTGLPRRSIGDWIGMIDYAEAPLLKKLGLNGESKFKLMNWPTTKPEWLEDALNPVSGTIAEDLDNSETGIDLATGEGSYLKAGDVIKIDDEPFWVSSVTGDTATVATRPFGGSAATHDNGAAWSLVGSARLEGANATTGYTTTTTNPYNYTQIFEEAVQVTRTEMKVMKYGVGDTMAYHLEKLIGGGAVGATKRAGKLPQLLQKTFYHGVRNQGSASAARSMGGFETFVTTNITNAASARLNKSMLETLVASIVEDGGKPDTLVVPTFQRRMITQLYGEDQVTYERDERTGGRRIDYLDLDFCRLEIMWDRLAPTNRIYIVESPKVGWITFDDFAVVDVASLGDYQLKDVVGEFSFAVVNEKAQGYIYGLATS